MIRLNLLPPPRLRQLAIAATVSHWRSAFWLVAAAALAAVVALQSVSFLLQDRKSTLAREVQSLDQQFDQSEAGAIRREIKSLNAAVAVFEQAVPTARSWAADLELLINSLPKDTTLTELAFTAHGEVTLVGISAFRADFLAFDDAIKKNTVLKNIKTESTASRRENLPFRYTAQWADTNP